MKKLLTFLAIMTIIASCGADNKVNSGGAQASGSNGVQESLIEFEGDYYLTSRNQASLGCSPTVKIRKYKEPCGGYILNSNEMSEEFCNINNGERRDNRFSQNGVLVVTQNGNELQSTLRIGQNAVFTNKLVLTGKTLYKSTKLKSRFEECTYQKDR